MENGVSGKIEEQEWNNQFINFPNKKIVKAIVGFEKNAGQCKI